MKDILCKLRDVLRLTKKIQSNSVESHSDMIVARNMILRKSERSPSKCDYQILKSCESLLSSYEDSFSSSVKLLYPCCALSTSKLASGYSSGPICANVESLEFSSSTIFFEATKSISNSTRSVLD